MRTLGIVQARLCSTRMPGKVLLPLDGETTLLECVLRAMRDAGPCLDEILVAVSDNPSDDRLVDFCVERKVRVFRGPEEDVLGRYLAVLERNPCDCCVRVCCDNPFLDSELLRELVAFFVKTRPDYAGYVVPSSGRPAICTPTGLVAECVRPGALARLLDSAPPPEIAQHVTLGIYSGGAFHCEWLPLPEWAARGWLRLTCDTADDVERLRGLFASEAPRRPREALVEWIARRDDIRGAMEAENARHAKPAVRIDTFGPG